MAVLSLMHSIFPRKEILEKCRKKYGFTLEKCRKRGVFTLEKCRNCSAPGVEGRGGEVKKMIILLSYTNIHKKLPHLNSCGSLFISNQFVVVVQNVANLQFVSFTSAPASMSLSFLL